VEEEKVKRRIWSPSSFVMSVVAISVIVGYSELRCLANDLFFRQAPRIAGKDAPSKITIASKEEPGERLIVSGKVLGPDGKTPLPGVSIYVYHTDSRGYYTPGTNDNQNPRLRGYLRTDAQGGYQFDTIKPASYPNSRVPAHIHYVVTSPGYKERVFEIVFNDDPFVDSRIRAEAAREESGFSIRSLERKNGILYCTQDIRLSRQ
jgi:protocatechuate 3,4-dioxygenase beta subunit